MKHWQELKHIVERVLRLAEQRRGSALAVVTRIEGSAYRRPGAKLLIEADGNLSGGVSGGCIEADVCQVGLDVCRAGTSRLLHYDTGDGDNLWGLGLGCDGEVDVVVLPVLEPAQRFSWSHLQVALAGDEPVALATLVAEGQGLEILVCNPSRRVTGGFSDAELDRASESLLRQRLAGLVGGVAGAKRPATVEQVCLRTLLVEVIEPPPRLAVFGAGDDARPLVALAATVGFRVDVVDHRQGQLTRQRFPEAERFWCLRSDGAATDLLRRGGYAVVKTHSFANDKAWVARWAELEPAYLGVLGPRSRIAKIAAETGVSPERLFGPVGLDVGADGPEQVAVSIVAELLAVRARRSGGHLRAREGSLHG